MVRERLQLDTAGTGGYDACWDLLPWQCTAVRWAHKAAPGHVLSRFWQDLRNSGSRHPAPMNSLLALLETA